MQTYYVTLIVKSKVIPVIMNSIQRSTNQSALHAILLLDLINEIMLNKAGNESLVFKLPNKLIMERFGLTDKQAKSAKGWLRHLNIITAGDKKKVGDNQEYWFNPWVLSMAYSSLARVKVNKSGDRIVTFVTKNKRGRIVDLPKWMQANTEAAGDAILESGYHLAKYTKILMRELREMAAGSTFARKYKKPSKKNNQSVSNLDKSFNDSWLFEILDDECNYVLSF